MGLNLNREELYTILSALAIMRSSIQKPENFWPEMREVERKVEQAHKNA
jgi:hypothetical protein